MPKRLGLHHASLRTEDLARSMAFYEKLGCTPIRRWLMGEAPAAMMDAGGGNILEFVTLPQGAEENPRFAHIALRSADADGDYAAALAAGAASHTPPKDVLLAGELPIRVAFVTGPDGELIEFFQEK